MLESEDARQSLLEELSILTIKAHKDLEATRQELAEKELKLIEIAKVAHEQINQAAKANGDLKQKVEFFQELSSTLNDKNQQLRRALIEVDTQKTHLSQLIKKYKKDLERLAERETELEIHRRKLVNMVEQKSADLVNAERTASLARLSSRLANGLRNPVTVIRDCTEILKHKKLDKDVVDKILRIEKANNKVAHQINDVLDLVGQTELYFKRYSINDILDATLDKLDITNTVKITRKSCDPVFNCDLKKMVSVFSNIILNACHAMNDKGEIIFKGIEDDLNVQIRIEDTGAGISKSNISKIFDPLYTTKDTGTGLGLSICKGIIEQHGGTIEVSSPPTVFKITMPKNLRGFYRASDSKLTSKE